MKKSEKVIQIAFKEVGYTENPANSNITKYGEWFGFNGVAWCAMFVSWCYAQAGCKLPNIGYSKGMAGCQTAVKYFKENNQIVEIPQVGDIIFFDWNGDGRYDHTEIFNGFTSAKKTHMYTIGGNTSLTNQSNGGSVMNRKRPVKCCIFVHPKVLD